MLSDLTGLQFELRERAGRGPCCGFYGRAVLMR
jgi:hypothetical protein